MFKPCCMVAVACVTLSGTAVADILHVPGDYPTIQEAIDAAMDGDEVEVHPGTYFETIDLLGKAITVRSSDGPDVTIIDAQGNGSVVTCNSGEGPDTVLEGFTITGGTGTVLGGGDFVGGGMYNSGSSPTVTNCIFTVNYPGGGMYNGNSSPSVANCIFSANFTYGDGAGMYNSDGSPTVTNCTFSGNTAGFWGGTGGDGGGMYNLNSSPTVTNCTFTGNQAGTIPHGGYGGGMYNSRGSSPTVTNCTFSGNTAVSPLLGGGGDGGGMFNVNDSSPAVTNCTFNGNEAYLGGGMYNSQSNPTVTNCTFSGNVGFIFGGAMLNEGSDPTVTNCTFSGNFALGGGGGMYNFTSNPTVTNCILWGDSSSEIEGPATVSYSDVAGGFAGLGNIDADPMFVDPINGDYRPSTGSPSIDAGNNWGVPIDADDYDQDGNTAELFPVDLDGNPRFNADEADFDPGCGVPVVVDMGAYEYQFAPVEEVIFADLNADGVVGILDLLGVLAAWGDAKNNCLADLDIDGDVGILDLLTLLSNWG
ncbi:MAG: right-handed parallel beta-helix repeat-containing protein [Planctomycetota bacterium]|nr:right-handed parallel beta-helix repeat-containing protein [Planctomycetota bacterium]